MSSDPHAEIVKLTAELAATQAELKKKEKELKRIKKESERSCFNDRHVRQFSFLALCAANISGCVFAILSADQHEIFPALTVAAGTIGMVAFLVPLWFSFSRKKKRARHLGKKVRIKWWFYFAIFLYFLVYFASAFFSFSDALSGSFLGWELTDRRVHVWSLFFLCLDGAVMALIYFFSFNLLTHQHLVFPSSPSASVVVDLSSTGLTQMETR